MPGWPQRIFLVRHGESAGNVARDLAEREGLPLIDIGVRRELDVPLSPLGERQARALARHFAQRPADERPSLAFASPYLRARRTAELALERLRLPLAIDERLREREFGVLNRLTRRGIRDKFPDLVELRDVLGKMYFRPPGGESWCDVALRLRSFLDTVRIEHPGQRILIATHQVVVLLFRYLIEGLSEEQVLEIDRGLEIANCSITEYVYDERARPGGGLKLLRFNAVEPLEEAGAPVTEEKDVPIAPR
jgi:broad specificity phosphatase PhoE